MSKIMDNLGTQLSPTWRARRQAPFTIRSIREELFRQAAALPEWQQQAYLDERLTELDRALDCDQAEALERWLDCEELLQGRPASIGDGGGGGSGRSVLSDDAMDVLASHAEIKRRLSPVSRQALAELASLMNAKHWDLDVAALWLIGIATAELTKIARVHAQQIAHPLTKYPKSSP
jgi:hypothetical protein